MSHRHFCDYAGHDWECNGFALRPIAGDTEPSECFCIMHGLPMEEGDHSECPVELLACPEHREKQLREMRALGTSDLARDKSQAESIGESNHDSEIGTGFCLWCGRSFESIEECYLHHADSACPVFSRYNTNL